MTYAALSTETAAAITAAGLDVDGVIDRVTTALDEDLAYGPDITTAATVPANQIVSARIASRSAGVVAGVPVALAVLDLVIGHVPDRGVTVERNDGEAVVPGDTVMRITAPTQALLTAERTALNFLCHLSGIASITARWAAAVAPAKVRDTRKTTPGLRVLEKYAVRCGGGVNHRMGLGDAALVKDNHVLAAGGVEAAIAAIRAADPAIPLEVECDRLSQVSEAIDAGVDLILLDNMTPAEMAAAVQLAQAPHRARVRFEASGGLTLETAAEVVATGVDFLAVGALTHSAQVLDLGLDVDDVLR